MSHVSLGIARLVEVATVTKKLKILQQRERECQGRMVSGAAIRLDFRRAKRAEACGSREEGCLVIFILITPRWPWVKVSITLNRQANQPSSHRIRHTIF